MSTKEHITWDKMEQKTLPFGDWILSGKDNKNTPILISRDDFLKQLENIVNH